MPSSKFEQWFPFYGPVLDLILTGDCQEQLCDPSANCSAIFAAYKATNGGATATDRCYNGAETDGRTKLRDVQVG